MFSYENCTMDELIVHINSTSRQALQQAFLRFTAQGKHDVVEKLRVGKIKAKIAKLMEEI